MRSLLFIAAILQIVWGMVPPASLVVLSEIPVEIYIALRWTISGSVFLSILFFRDRWLPAFKKETFWVVLLGISGYGVASFGTLYGLKTGGIVNFALIGSLGPLITSGISILVLKEKPSRFFYLAVCICVVGLLFLVLGKHQVSSWDIAVTSSLLIIGAAVLEAIVFVFSKKLKIHFTSTQYLAIAQLGAALFMWLLELGVFHQFSTLAELTAKGWIAAVFVSIIACVICYSILYWLLNFIDGHRLALFDGLHALSGTLFGWLVFKESLNGLMVFGGVLLIVGLILGNSMAKDEIQIPLEIPVKNPSN